MHYLFFLNTVFGVSKSIFRLERKHREAYLYCRMLSVLLLPHQQNWVIASAVRVDDDVMCDSRSKQSGLAVLNVWPSDHLAHRSGFVQGVKYQPVMTILQQKTTYRRCPGFRIPTKCGDSSKRNYLRGLGFRIPTNCCDSSKRNYLRAWSRD